MQAPPQSPTARSPIARRPAAALRTWTCDRRVMRAMYVSDNGPARRCPPGPGGPGVVVTSRVPSPVTDYCLIADLSRSTTVQLAVTKLPNVTVTDLAAPSLLDNYAYKNSPLARTAQSYVPWPSGIGTLCHHCHKLIDRQQLIQIHLY
eukprot:762988-Hanusia_phi.AAC.1